MRIVEELLVRRGDLLLKADKRETVALYLPDKLHRDVSIGIHEVLLRRLALRARSSHGYGESHARTHLRPVEIRCQNIRIHGLILLGAEYIRQRTAPGHAQRCNQEQNM